MGSNHCYLYGLLGAISIGISIPSYGEGQGDTSTRGLGRESTKSVQATEAKSETNIPTPRPEIGRHTSDINQSVITLDGSLLTVSDDKTARLWRLDGASTSQPSSRGLGRLATSVASSVMRIPIGPHDEGKLYAVAASPIKNRAVVAGSTGLGVNGKTSVYYVLDLASLEVKSDIQAIDGSVRVLSYSQDGRYLAIGSDRGFLRVIEPSQNKTVLLENPDSACKDEVTAAKFLRDGRLVTTCLDGQLRLYDTAFHIAKIYRFPPKHRPWRLAVSPQEEQLAVGSQDDAVVSLFSLADLQPLGQLKGDPKQNGNLSVVAWVGGYVFGVGTYGNQQGTRYLRTWNISTKQAQEWPLADNTINDLTPLPDGRLAFVTTEPSVGVFDPKVSQVTTKYPRLIPDFRDASKGTFAVSDDGTVVDFGLSKEGRTPVRFDFTQRTLVSAPQPRADLHRPVEPKELKNWRNSTRPTLASKPLALSQGERSLSAASAPDGSALIGADFSLQLWRKGKQIWNIDVPAPAWAVNLTPNGRFALAALGDGTLRWYDGGSGREILALFATTDNRWLVWNPDGYFDHSEGAADLIGYHLNQGTGTPRFVSSGQMHSRFYRPDILEASITGSGISPVATQPTNIQSIVTQHHAPDVKLVAWCARGQCKDVEPSPDGKLPNITTDAPEVTLRFRLEDKGSGIGNLVVRRDGANVSTRGLGRLESPKAVAGGEKGPVILERAVALERGNNEITATAFDADQSLDAGESVHLPIQYQTAVAEARTLHILSIGIDKYATQQLNKLKNAVNDAEGIAKKLTTNSQGIFDEADKNKVIVKQTVLVNEKATLTGIQQATQKLAASAKPDDLVVLFLAGHGMAIDGRYYFLPYDIDISSEEKAKATALTQDILAESLSSLPTSRTVVLIDSCYSGAFAISNKSIVTWLGTLQENTGRAILTGTSKAQEALDGINGHGVFTSVVLNGLDGQADKDKDQFVNVSELITYAKKEVKIEAGKLSHTQEATGLFVGDDFFKLSTYQKNGTP